MLYDREFVTYEFGASVILSNIIIREKVLMKLVEGM
jgi:hypothetical protein